VDDTLTPVEAATDLAEGIPGAELVVLPDVGHVSNLEGPHEFTVALDRFLDGIPTA
jgi:pimeloyl-ACP methyl ester carboxylesterase